MPSVHLQNVRFALPCKEIEASNWEYKHQNIEFEIGNVIYINTNSVKHWWKANSAWRKEHGFGGNFSKKKLKELLNAKFQANTFMDRVG